MATSDNQRLNLRGQPRPRSMPMANKVMVTMYRAGMGRAMSDRIILLTTIGRKSGHKRTTPIGYVCYGERLYAISGFGKWSDWYRNLLANPQAALRIGPRTLAAQAETVEDEGEKVAVLKRFQEQYGPDAERFFGITPTMDEAGLRAIAGQRVIVGFEPVVGSNVTR